VAFQGAAGPDDTYGIVAQAWYQLNAAGLRRHARRMRATTSPDRRQDRPLRLLRPERRGGRRVAKFMNNAFVHNPLLDSGGDIGADAYGFQPGAILKYENSHEKGGEWAFRSAPSLADTGADFSGSWSDPFVIGQIETNARFNFLPGTYRAYAWSNGRGAELRRDAAPQQRLGRVGRPEGPGGPDALRPLRPPHRGQGQLRPRADAGRGTRRHAVAPFRRCVGFAYGRLETSDDYRRDSLAVAGYRASGSEYQSELYYRFKLNDAIELSPSYQWIRNPGGDQSADTVKVAGLRAKLGF
jgi:high affinity Mn2+ porin